MSLLTAPILATWRDEVIFFNNFLKNENGAFFTASNGTTRFRPLWRLLRSSSSVTLQMKTYRLRMYFNEGSSFKSASLLFLGTGLLFLSQSLAFHFCRLVLMLKPLKDMRQQQLQLTTYTTTHCAVMARVDRIWMFQSRPCLQLRPARHISIV